MQWPTSTSQETPTVTRPGTVSICAGEVSSWTTHSPPVESIGSVGTVFWVELWLSSPCTSRESSLSMLSLLYFSTLSLYPHFSSVSMLMLGKPSRLCSWQTRNWLEGTSTQTYKGTSSILILSLDLNYIQNLSHKLGRKERLNWRTKPHDILYCVHSTFF